MSADEPPSNRLGVPATALGAVVRHLRDRQGWSQASLSHAADLSAAMIAKVESGDRAPSRTTLHQIAAALGTTGDLLEQAAHAWEAIRTTDEVELASVVDDLVGEVPALALAAEQRWPAEVPERRRRAGLASPDPIGEAPGAGLARLVQQGAAPVVLERVLTTVALELREDDEGQLQRLEGRLRRLLRVPVRDVDDLVTLAELLSGPPLGSLPPEDRTRLLGMLADDLRRGRESQRVANFPSGRVGYLLPTTVTRSEDGQYWVSPDARAFATGLPDQDPRFERLDDGRIRLDLSRLPDDLSWPAPADGRPLIRAMLVGGEPRSLDELAEVYASTVIKIAWGDHALTLTPRPNGETGGELPAGASVVHVLTAHNPRSRLLLASENDERDRMLEQRLKAEGWTVHRATGRSPNQSWSEDGWAIVNAPRDDVLALAREYEQNAIFEWTPNLRSVVWTQVEREDALGWSAILGAQSTESSEAPSDG